MEMHLIFYKKQYDSITNAARANDGIAIVAVFFKVYSIGILIYYAGIRQIVHCEIIINSNDLHIRA
jgi:NADH:ubiquinone oxidoreductase subunit K